MASRPWCNMRIDYWNNFKGAALVGGFFFIKVLKFIYNSTCYYNKNEWNKNETKICIYVNFIECKASYSQEICKSILVFLLARWLIVFII